MLEEEKKAQEGKRMMGLKKLKTMFSGPSQSTRGILINKDKDKDK